MSTKIPVCPECDSSRFRPRSGRHNGLRGWYCDQCDKIHGDAAYREPYTASGINRDTLARKLLEMDPSEVSAHD